MKLEDMCVSLELAKRLRELDVDQLSYFYWDDSVDNPRILSSLELNSMNEKFIPPAPDCFSAFTVAELGKMLPFRIFYNERWHGIEMVKGSREYVITYRFGVSQCPRLVIFDKTEANARAKMIIHLIENRLIEVKDE